MGKSRSYSRVPMALAKWFGRGISEIYVDLFYKDFWALKAKTKAKPTMFRKLVYYSYLHKHGSWVGLNSDIKSTPVLPHGLYGIFISDRAVIGENVTIFHQVTIGSNTIKGSKRLGSPTIGDNVYIGCGAKIIGNLTVGNNCRIGANCIVANDVPDNSLAVLKCTEIINRTETMENKFVPITGV